MKNRRRVQETLWRRHSVRRMLGLLVGTAIAAIVVAPALAQERISWGGSLQYDDGSNPSVAISGTTAVEVHEGTLGTLWYRTGELEPNGTISWSGSSRYDAGSLPSVAVSGVTVVEVHQGFARQGPGPLWYRTGQLQPNGTLQWGGSVQYDNGSLPAVASSGTTVVEVHQGDAGSLWYHSGQIEPDGSIQWGGSFQYDSGYTPSVAVSGTTVVEAHEGNPGTLWYRTGQIQLNGAISWKGSLQYDSGYFPSVAASGTTVVEVHQANNSFDNGPLWYRPALLGPNGTLKWGYSSQYDDGSLPEVRVSGTTVVEVHQGDPGTLWNRMGQD
jgi:hypothetical protein